MSTPSHRWPSHLLAASLAAATLATSIVVLRAQPPLAPQPAAPTAQPPAAKSAIRFGSPDPVARPAGAIRLASYNVQNLFDDADDPALTGDIDDKNETKAPEQCQAVADAIRRIDADILGLSEIESLAALTAFRDKYLSGLGYDHVVSLDAGDARGIENAVLSRFPLSEAKVWIHVPLGGTHPAQLGGRAHPDAGKPIVCKRSPLHVKVTVPGATVQRLASAAGTTLDKPSAYELTLFVVHHKSGRDYAYWRERDTARVVSLAGDITKAAPTTNIIILGDFNAISSDEAMKVYERAGFLDAFGGVGGRAERDPLTTSHESGRTYAHIRLSPTARAEFVPASRFVLGTPARPAGANWQTTPPPPGYASDHYPVVIDLHPWDIALPTGSPPSQPATPPAEPSRTPTPPK